MSELPSPHLHAKDPAACAGIDGSYPLACHLLDTALVIRAAWETRVPTRLKLRIEKALAAAGYTGDPVKVAMLAGALHDIGKANSWFQYQEREGSPWAADLADRLDRPGTDPRLIGALRGERKHPLRRHEVLSFRAAAGQWHDDAMRVADEHWLAMIAGGHHGYWRSSALTRGEPLAPLGEEFIAGWSEVQSAFVAIAEEAVGLRLADVPAFTDRSGIPVFTVLSGLLTLADWLASDDSQVSAGKTAFAASSVPYGSPEWTAEWMESRDVSLRNHVAERLGPLGAATTSSWSKAILTDRTTGAQFSPRPLQIEALEGVRPEGDDGLWIVMYPTGDGKTEASALRHALQPDEGIIFGLPTRATTDAIEKRLDPWLADAGALLTKSHQFAGLDDQPRQSGDSCATNGDWYTATIRKLVSPNLVATCDQVLAGALAQRHLTFRLYGLATHHVVLDEVHTYDVYQTALLLELLTWWGATGTRVTLLSATLPTNHLAQMARAYRSGATGEDAADVAVPPTTFPSTLFVPADPEQPLTAVDGDPTTISRKPQPTVFTVTTAVNRVDRVGAHVDWVHARTVAHPCSPVAVVTNTVGDCSAVALALDATSSTHDVVCLHAAMVDGHRTAAEQTLQKRLGKGAHARGFESSDPARRPVIVVGTQVIQASLDFDVDFMSSDLAAAPDVIQRLGRQWRFETELTASGDRATRVGIHQPRRMHLVAVGEHDKNDGFRVTAQGAIPYLPSVLQRTFDWLATHPEQTSGLPVDVFEHSQSWVDAAYDRDPDALLACDSVADDQMREIVRELTLLRESEFAKADLNGVLLNGRRRSRWRSPTWGNLAEMTSRNTDEAVMRTRYIDFDTQTVLLHDSTGRGHYFAADGTRIDLPAYPGLSLGDAPPSQAASLLRLAIPVPSSLRAYADDAINATLGTSAWRDEWKPRSKALRSIPPLDLAELDGIAHYSPLTGLTKEPS